MGHAHHDHDHAHGGSGAKGRAFFVGIVLNLVVVVVEAVYGVAAHSMALLADAGHNLGDVLGLVLAGSAALLARRRPTKRHTYGYRRLTLLAALANGVFLLVATGGIAWESVRRLVDAGAGRRRRRSSQSRPSGAVVNGASALLFLRGRERDLNVKAAFLHLAGDAGIALGVVVAGFVVLRTGLVVARSGDEPRAWPPSSS